MGFLLPIVVVAALLLGNIVNAQNSNVPHGGGTCETDWDCSLGGECTNGSCVCDIWFTGTDCHYLNLQAPESTEVGTCGTNFDSYYSWGGKTLIDTTTNPTTYHLYASFMCRHQNLGAWTTASSSAHFISNDPVGPYSWAPTDCGPDNVCAPSVIPWSHNTVMVENIPGEEPRYLLFHIGDGVADPSYWYPCYNLSDIQSPSSSSSVTIPLNDTLEREINIKLHSSSGIRAGPGNTAYVATADNYDGPWTRAFNNTGVFINFTNSWTTALAGNPAPLLLDNGTALLYFTATPCPPNSGALAANCIAVAVSENGWSGPFDMRQAPHPITYPESEDPFVFRDPRGNYHLLTNVNTCHARCASGVPCGGHAFSRDGITFSNLTIGAFGPVITFANGSQWNNAYVERPLVTLDSNGIPLSFHVGMGRSNYLDSCNWVQRFCTPDNSTLCGPTIPTPPPPPVPVKLLNNNLCLMFNASAFPCSGVGPAAGCPVVMGSCTDSGSLWLVANDLTTMGPITSGSNASTPAQPLALNVDCDNTAPHTLVKVLASGQNNFVYDASSKTIQYGSTGMCLNTGQGPPVPPCGPKTELWLPNQIQLISCNDPTAAGWTIVAA